MPINDIVYNSDLANYPYGYGCPNGGDGQDKKEVEKIYVVMPPPPSKFPLYPYAPPYPCPPLPFPPHPHPDDDSDTHPAKQSDVEKQICKLSRQSANLRALIESIEDKNKPCIVKSSSYSYSLGELQKKDPQDESQTVEDENVATIVTILKAELDNIKQEIKDLSDEITTDEP